MNPQATLNAVVLPAPLGPIIPTISPDETVNETSLRARSPSKCTETWSRASAKESVGGDMVFLKISGRRHLRKENRISFGRTNSILVDTAVNHRSVDVRDSKLSASWIQFPSRSDERRSRRR